jgi:hypothetical protein
MDIGALKRDDFEVWVPFMEDAQVLMGYVSLEKLDEIEKAATVRTWNRKHQMEERVDRMKANRLIGRAAVRDWKGITDEGKEYPYSQESCDFLMTHWAEFSQFVNNTCNDLQRLKEEERKAAVGNSSLTSGEEGTSRG